MERQHRRFGLRRRTLAVLGALALAGVAGGVAWAAIPDLGEGRPESPARSPAHRPAQVWAEVAAITVLPDVGIVP